MKKKITEQKLINITKHKAKLAEKLTKIVVL